MSSPKKNQKNWTKKLFNEKKPIILLCIFLLFSCRFFLSVFLCVFCLRVCVLCSLFTGCESGSHEKRLLHTLLDNYNVLERPVVNESDPLQLSFGLTLMQIIDVVNIHLL